MIRVTGALLAAVALLLVAGNRHAHAQGLGGRVALEAIGATSAQARTLDDPMVIVDVVGTVRLSDGLDVVLRPWGARRPGGDWMFEMYQLQLRYVSSTRVRFRIDGGIIPSPIGLFTLELQPHRNPLVNPPFYYFAPLPAVDGRFDRVRMVSGGYPLGAMFSVSGGCWDARAGITDSAPVQPRNIFSAVRRPAHAQLVVGGGVTPVVGMRLGAALTRGQYRPGPTSAAPPPDSGTATVFALEGEYAIGHTRVSGEWIRDRFETALGTTTARGVNVQAVRTLSPRTFAAGRVAHASSPISTLPVEVRRAATSVETTLGYRLTTELTLRGGYQRERGYGDARWRHAAVMSIVWAERWW